MSRKCLALALAVLIVRSTPAAPVPRQPAGTSEPTGSVVSRLDHGATIDAVAFTPDGRELVTAGDGNAVQVWDLATGKIRLRLDSGKHPVRSVALDAAGKRLVAGTSYGHVFVWNLDTGRLVRNLATKEDAVSTLALSPDGRCLAAGLDGITGYHRRRGAKLTYT